nr:hypothetical protein Iba_chr13fCG10410 [Ipomoea batatas]
MGLLQEDMLDLSWTQRAKSFRGLATLPTQSVELLVSLEFTDLPTCDSWYARYLCRSFDGLLAYLFSVFSKRDGAYAVYAVPMALTPILEFAVES